MFQGKTFIIQPAVLDILIIYILIDPEVEDEYGLLLYMTGFKVIITLLSLISR